MKIEDLIADAQAFVEHSMPTLGYDSVRIKKIEIGETETYIVLVLDCEDNFQERVNYSHQKQVGYIRFSYPFTTKGKLNREQRELHVLASQTADSKAIADAMVSAAGRRFAEELVASRDRFQALVDFSDQDAL